MKNIHYDGSVFATPDDVTSHYIEDPTITMPSNRGNESQPIEAQQLLEQLNDRAVAWADEKDKIKAALDDAERQGNRLADGAKKMKRRFGMES